MTFCMANGLRDRSVALNSALHVDVGGFGDVKPAWKTSNFHEDRVLLDSRSRKLL